MPFIHSIPRDYAESMSLSDQHAAELSPETVVVAAGRPERAHDEPVNPPIVLSSTYFGTGSLGDGDRGYGRYANPTWDPFEDALAKLEGATLPGLLYASGLAAVSSALSLVPAGGVAPLVEPERGEPAPGVLPDNEHPRPTGAVLHLTQVLVLGGRGLLHRLEHLVGAGLRRGR